MTVIDLWELPPSKLTSTLTDRVEHDFYARCPPEKRPLSHRQMTIPVEKAEGNAESYSGNEDKALYDSSLFKALHTTYRAQWWTAGIFKLVAGLSPLAVPQHASDTHSLHRHTQYNNTSRQQTSSDMAYGSLCLSPSYR